MPSKRFSSAAPSGSRSVSGPTSGSNRSSGTTSTIAPSRAPAASRSETARSSSGMATSGLLPEATSVTVLRNRRASEAVDAARSRRSSARSIWSGPAASVDPRGMRGMSGIDLSPSLEGTPQRDLIGVLQVPPDGQARGQPRHLQSHRDEHPSEVGGGRLPLDVRVHGQDHLGDRAVGQPGHQLGDPQVVRTDARDRVDGPAEHVVPAAELPGALDRDDVLGLLDDADRRERPARVAADAAQLLLRDVAAQRAEPHASLDLGECVDEPADVRLVCREHVESDALGALGTDPGQPPELVDQILDRTLVHALTLRPPPDGARSVSYTHLTLPTNREV